MLTGTGLSLARLTAREHIESVVRDRQIPNGASLSLAMFTVRG